MPPALLRYTVGSRRRTSLRLAACVQSRKKEWYFSLSPSVPPPKARENKGVRYTPLI
jgi:hypothetical protein